MKKYLIILAAIILIAGIAGYFFYKRPPEISYKSAKIERGTIVSTVAATGNLSAVTTVQVYTGLRHHSEAVCRLQLAGKKRSGDRRDRPVALQCLG